MIPHRDLYYDERGVILRGGRNAGPRVFDQPGVHAVVIPWARFGGIYVSEEYPEFRVAERRGPQVDWHRVRPRVGRDEAFVEYVAGLVDEAARRSLRLRRGWL
ncbi:MAG: hypothetical protein AAGF12_25730, partial [Myxococcota bacterium]